MGEAVHGRPGQGTSTGTIAAASTSVDFYRFCSCNAILTDLREANRRWLDKWTDGGGGA